MPLEKYEIAIGLLQVEKERVFFLISYKFLMSPK